MPTSASLRLFIAALMLAWPQRSTVPGRGAAARAVGQSDGAVGEGEGAAEGAAENPGPQLAARHAHAACWSSRTGATGASSTRSRCAGSAPSPSSACWALLVLFYLIRGMVKIESGRSGRTLVRFNAFERFVHWMTAASFVVLALSGLNITFGKELLTPLIGAVAFAEWSQWAKYAHNYLSFPFTLGVVLMFLMWLAWNFPTPTDFRWIAQGGGIVGSKHPPAKRFNAGQKVIYWVVVLGGGAAAVTGYLLMFPFYATDIAGMQLAQMVHGIVGVLFIAIMLAHIYIGTVGMQGAFEAMGKGEVDVNWARQHHSLWLEKEAKKGRVRGPAPAE